MVKREITIPYDEKGNMLQWDYARSAGRRQNSIWSDELIYLGYSRGRSAVNFEWRSAYTGREYSMFLSDMDDILKESDFIAKRIRGQFTYSKRGQNYGIEKVGDIPENENDFGEKGK